MVIAFHQPLITVHIPFRSVFFFVLLGHLFRRRSLCWRTAIRLNNMLVAATGLNTQIFTAGLRMRVGLARLNMRLIATGLNNMRVAATGLSTRVVVAGLNTPVVMPGILVSLCVFSVAIISDGVLPPIVVASLPSMKMFQPN